MIVYREPDVERCIQNVYKRWMDPDVLEDDEDRETLREVLTEVLRELDKIPAYRA